MSKAYENQYSEFVNLATAVKGTMFVVATHTSKSKELPVVKIETPGGSFLIRNNFYDFNLAVDWRSRTSLLLSDLYEKKGLDFYRAEMNRKRRYSFGSWSDEEINDPRILRVFKNNRWDEVSGDEKDRWLNRHNSTAWFNKDWSSSFLVQSGDDYYLAPYAFSEGLRRYEEFQPYVSGEQRFIVALRSVGHVETLMRKVCHAEV